MQVIDGQLVAAGLDGPGAAAGGAGAGAAGGGFGAALKVAGGVIGAIGILDAAHATAKALKQKAKLARKEGREAKRLSDYRVHLIHQAGTELLGQIEAETGQSGLAMTGTPLMSLVDNARQVELSAAMENRSGQITQQRYEDAAVAAEADARSAKRAGKFGALGALLGSA
jgi:hypothetical protein